MKKAAFCVLSSTALVEGAVLLVLVGYWCTPSTQEAAREKPAVLTKTPAQAVASDQLKRVREVLAEVDDSFIAQVDASCAKLSGEGLPTTRAEMIDGIVASIPIEAKNEYDGETMIYMYESYRRPNKTHADAVAGLSRFILAQATQDK